MMSEGMAAVALHHLEDFFLLIFFPKDLRVAVGAIAAGVHRIGLDVAFFGFKQSLPSPGGNSPFGPNGPTEWRGPITNFPAPGSS